MRYTPEQIVSLEENQIFVFGSNLKGVHGAGAAALAYKLFEAEWGVGEGLTGRCYAFPTKDKNIKSRCLKDIGKSFQKFITCVVENPEYNFLLTKVGCGLAGYDANAIAREFWSGMSFNKQENIPINLWVPKEFVFVKNLTYKDKPTN